MGRTRHPPTTKKERAKMNEHDDESTLFPVSPEESQVDGPGAAEAAGPGDEMGHVDRVRAAIGSYLKSKRQRK